MMYVMCHGLNRAVSAARGPIRRWQPINLAIRFLSGFDLKTVGFPTMRPRKSNST